MSNPRAINRPVVETPTLLPDRAFVVEFSGDGGTARDERLCGRVEHVISGQAARFATAGELLEFVQGVLRSRKPTRKRRSVTTDAKEKP